GVALTRSHGVVTLTTAAGRLSPVTDHQNGTYSATLTAATAGGTATVRAWLAGQPLANVADVEMRGLPSPYGTAYGLITAPWGAPLPNLPVELKGQTAQIAVTGTTDANGYYRFESLPPGTYTVLVPTYDATHPSASGTVAVTASAQTRLDLQVTSRGSLAVEANPAVIAADRTTSARINVQVRRFYGEILRGADLRYETTGGTLSQTTGSSNQSGNASVTLTAPQTNTGGFSTVEVRVYARSDRDGLFVMKTVPVTVSPVSVEGVALDARTGRPIAGAIAEIREDLNGDRTVDFVSQVTTGADGRYRFAVPEVNRVYHIALSIPVTVESNTLWIPATQVARVPSNPGPTVYADRQIAGQVLLRDGRTGGLRAPDRPESLLGTVLVYNQFREDVPVLADGSFTLEGVREGTHRILFRHVLGVGTEMAGVVVQAGVNQAGALAVSLPIIDPYAVVRDTDNHPLSGVTLELYWADTYRNRQAGRTPNTLVTLPVLTDLDTRWDSVPQVSASNGRYGWMLYANADYYIKARKNGYEAYDSRTSRRYVLSTTGTDSTVSNGILSVGSALAKLDLTLRPLSEIEPAAPANLRARTEPGKVVLNWQSVADAESYTVYRAPANGGSFVPVVRGLRSTSFVDNGVTPGTTYVYKVAAAGNSVEGQASTSVSIQALETDPPAPAPEPETPTPEPPAPPTTQPETPPAPATPPPAPALVHRGYIMGYPDGTFQPDRSISRAEVAAVLARVLQADGQAAGLAPHTDVPAGHWANLYIAIVAQRGLMRGDPDGRFRPDDPITRAEVATIAARLKNLAPESHVVFTDIDGHWAAGWIGAAYRAGFVKGYPDGDFRPEVAISRAEFVTVVNRLQGRGPLVGRPTAKWPDVPASHWAHGQVEEASVSHEADAPLSETGGEIWRKDTN
ncbi:MAG TPA: S-layer homology domain-containing protein, partial [Symbiobacteriaceae bacterium]|nr:S-layer homology domain-containing protein [Symbiobacteriaceae bacterium]